MVFIGFDQSLSKCAYVIIEGETILDFGVFKSSVDDGDTSCRINIIVSNIINLCKQYPDAKISLEGLAFGGTIGNSSRDLAGLYHIIINRLKYDLNIENIVTIAPTTVKKFATNSGKAKKKELFDALPENVKKLFKDKKYKVSTGLYDITDAYYICKYNQKLYQESKV